MKKSIIIFAIAVVVLVLLFLIIKPSFTGYYVYNNEITEKVKLGYCPTMQEDATSLAKEKNYELIKFDSASEVLSALKNNQIDKAIIGRKAEKNELNSNIKETILKSGYTIVSNKKGFIDYLGLPSIEVYTYLSNEIVEGLIPVSSKITYVNKNEIIKQINEGKIVLIPLEDWNDNFELIVVMDDNEKDKEFRGIFLYFI